MESVIRHDWNIKEVSALFDLPFNELLYRAQGVHHQHFDPNAVQISTLLSIKTGACPEDCKYCPQSVRHQTQSLESESLMVLDAVLERAREAKEAGASRFCMGAAWRNPKERDMPALLEMVRQVKALDLETCMTLGMLNGEQAQQLADAGLDYYNHNLDTSKAYYPQIITTRTYQDRLDTLVHVRDVGLKICTGGILGMGETMRDRAALLVELAHLEPHPESVPINMLIRVEGTPLSDLDDLDGFEFIRAIAVARIMMPRSHLRLSAGREQMNEQMQALCFMAGANSIFYGCKLLTARNASEDRDRQLFAKLGLYPEPRMQKPDPIVEQELHESLRAERIDTLCHDAGAQ